MFCVNHVILHVKFILYQRYQVETMTISTIFFTYLLFKLISLQPLNSSANKPYFLQNLMLKTAQQNIIFPLQPTETATFAI